MSRVDRSKRTRSRRPCLTLPGFEPADVSITTTSREVIVHATTKTDRKGEEETKKGAKEKLYLSEFRSNDVYRRVELAKDISEAPCRLFLFPRRLESEALKSGSPWLALGALR